MDILKLQKEKLIESTIINCNRNLFIYEELMKRLPELIDDNLNYYKNKDQQSFEKMILVKELLRRRGMFCLLETKHPKLNFIINFFEKTLKKMDEIEYHFKVEVIEENGKKKCLLKCEDFLIKEFEYTSIFDMLKELLQEENDRDLDLFVISAFYFNVDEPRALLAWAENYLNRDDLKKLKEYRKVNPNKNSIEYAVEKTVENVWRRYEEAMKKKDSQEKP